jgi:hypothetical protein
MILTQQEAVDILKLSTASEYPELNILLSAVDEYIKSATGKDWGVDTTIDPIAKMAACVLLVRWFEDPGMMGKVDNTDKGFIGLISQLHAKVAVESVVT